MKIAVVGLGYVGLPLALAFARKFPGTIGFDISKSRIEGLRESYDYSGEVTEEELRSSKILFTDKPEDMQGCDYYIIGVPTPIDENKSPDLTPLISASEKVGAVLKKGSTVVYESTVYPGVTENICAPVLARVSGLQAFKDFYLAYTPERINPGDKVHTLEKVIKIVSGQDEETLKRVSDLYGQIVKAGIHQASSIKVAEAAKVIENAQRDLNIALMNELAIIFDLMDISTLEVLEAAGTKWNFLPFRPGLVGGHCIGVDPFYLTTAAQRLGYHPEVILAGRRINDGVGRYVGQKTIKLLVQSDVPVKDSRIAVLGLTFKENVSDVRNSRVPDIVHELQDFGCKVFVHDPRASAHDVEHEYGIHLCDWTSLRALDAVVLAVAHDEYCSAGTILPLLKKNGVLVDVKSTLSKEDLPKDLVYWSL